MAGWPSAAQDRLPADVPRARHGRPGVPRRPLAVGRGGWGGFIPHADPGQGLWRVDGVEVDAGLVWLVAAGERCVSSRATTSTGTPRRISPDVICLVCEPVRGWRPPVWFLAGPVGHLSADRWQPASYRVPAVPRGTDAGRRSAARSPRSAFVFAGGRSQPDLLDERMSVGCPGGGVTTGSEPAPAGAAPGLGRGRARVTGGGYRQVPYRTDMRNAITPACFVKLTGSAPAGSHLQGLRSPEGDVEVVEGDQLICCEPQPRAGRRRGKQGERPDEHLGCLAGAEPAGEGQPRRRQSWPRSGRQSFQAVSRRGPDLPRSASCLFLSPRC